MDYRRPALAIVIAVGWPASVSADVVTLVNGDRLTGTVRRVADGRLTLQSRMAGTVQIPWRNIRSLQADARFSVLTGGGQRYDGQLSFEDSQVLIAGEGQRPVELQPADIARVERGARPRGVRGLVSAVSGTADIGFSVARGNQNQIQASTGASAAYTSAQYKFSGRLNSLFARQDGARSQSRHALNARLDRYLDDRSFAYALGALERNERRLLDLRSRLGGGMGWRLRRSGSADLSLLGGVAFVHERLRDQPNRATAESFGGLEWATSLFQVVRVSNQLTVHPNLLNTSRVRLEYDGSLRVPIAGRYTYTLSVFNRYDTQPAAMVERNDYGLVTGVGMKF